LRKSASATLTKSTALTAIAGTGATEDVAGATEEEAGFTDEEAGFTEDDAGFTDEEAGVTLETGATEDEAGAADEPAGGSLGVGFTQAVMPSANMSVIILKNLVFFIITLQLYVAFLSLRFFH
jgi:hypothetical protein